MKIAQHPLTAVLEQMVEQSVESPLPDLQSLVEVPKLLEVLRKSRFLTSFRLLRLQKLCRKANEEEQQKLVSQLSAVPTDSLDALEKEQLGFVQSLGGCTDMGDRISFILSSKKTKAIPIKHAW